MEEEKILSREHNLSSQDIQRCLCEIIFWSRHVSSKYVASVLGFLVYQQRQIVFV